MDSWAGHPWAAAMATGSPGAYAALRADPLTPGVHIGYAFVTNGEEATSTTTGAQSAPAIANIGGYEFLVAPPLADISPASLSFGNQQTQTPSAAQTITLANPGGAALTFSYGFTGTNAGDFSEGAGDTCGTASGQLAPGASCTIFHE